MNLKSFAGQLFFVGAVLCQRQPRRNPLQVQPQAREDVRSSGSWPSSESLWSDIPKSSSFDIQNWRNWQSGTRNSDDDHDDSHAHYEPVNQFQKVKQFKRHIPHNTVGKNPYEFSPDVKDGQEFYPSAPISRPSSFSEIPTSHVSEGQPFNFQVSYNEGEDYNDDKQPVPFRQSPQDGAERGQDSFSTSGFSPSFGANSFPTTIGYTQPQEPVRHTQASFYEQDEDEEEIPKQQQKGFGFTSPFGDQTDKEGRLKGRQGVSQSYSTFTGPDGQRTGFFVSDHNNPGQPNEQIKQQIENSIQNFQGQLNPSKTSGFDQLRFGPEDDADEDEEGDDNEKNNFVYKRSPYGTNSPPPTILYGNDDRYSRGSTTNEKFHKADENAGGYDSKKAFRQPLKNIQYNREAPDKKNEKFGDSFAVVKTFKGGYSSDDKDAPARPPNNYNYGMIDDDESEGQFDGQEEKDDSQENRPKRHFQINPQEDYYVPSDPQDEERVRPKYEEMDYDERRGKGLNTKQRKVVRRDDDDDESEDNESQRPRSRPSHNQRRRAGQRSLDSKKKSKRPVEENQEEDETRWAPKWIWDPVTIKLNSKQ